MSVAFSLFECRISSLQETAARAVAVEEAARKEGDYFVPAQGEYRKKMNGTKEDIASYFVVSLAFFWKFFLPISQRIVRVEVLVSKILALRPFRRMSRYLHE